MLGKYCASSVTNAIWTKERWQILYSIFLNSYTNSVEVTLSDLV